MTRMRKTWWTVLVVLVIACSGLCQDITKEFVLDKSKEYVYIAFDHVGKRVPVLQGEGTDGLWLRLVNNCQLPIHVAVFNSGPGNAGFGVFDEIVPVEHMIVDPQRKRLKPPQGYRGGDVSSIKTLSPGSSLLFSVPKTHVAPDWALRVPFDLGASDALVSGNVHSYVDFSWYYIPEEYRSSAQAGPSFKRHPVGTSTVHKSQHVKAAGP